MKNQNHLIDMKKQYVQPGIVCYQFCCSQTLMVGSNLEVEVHDEDFDSNEMESLTRKNNFDLWRSPWAEE